jgi:hypothetical protein
MNLSQEQAVFRPEPNENLRSPIIFGRKYFDAFERFSNKAKFTIQAPMANQSTKANAIAFVAQCVKRMGVEMIEAIELGNEPDLYETQNIRDPPYLPRDFAIETANHIKSLEAGIPNLPQGRIFQVFEKSSQMADDKPQWQYA